MPSKNTSGNERVVLVFGATGQQGGAVATALRERGCAVRALVRNPCSAGAQALADKGIAVVQGDLSDMASMRSAMTGAYGVFSVQPSSGQGAAYNVTDADEIRYGKAIGDIAVDSGVQHLVYTSVNAAGSEKTGMGHFDSKAEIEAYLRGLDLVSTIVRPAGFMELLMLPGMGLDKGFLTSFVRTDQRAQVIAVQDIGTIVASIFASPDRFAGRTIEIAGDEITGAGLQASLSRAAARPIAYRRFPDSLLNDNPFLGRLAALFDDGRLAGNADIAALEAEFGKLTSFDDWLNRPGRPLLQAALKSDDAPIALR